MKKILLICFLATLIGCGGINPPPTPITVDVPSTWDYTPMLSWVVAENSTPDQIVPDPSPRPPEPVVGDPCPTCGGTGLLGDGVVMLPCRSCGGDGIIHEDDPINTGIVAEESIIVVPKIIIPSPEYTFYVYYLGYEYIWNKETGLFENRVGGIIDPGEEIEDISSIDFVTMKDGNTSSSVDVQKRELSKEGPQDYATPEDVVEDILGVLKPKSNEVFLDIGSGDGRVVILAALKYGCKAIGIEQDPERVLQARKNAKDAGVEDNVQFIEGNFVDIEWPDADVGYLYLFPEDLALVKNKLAHLNRFASFSHQVPGLTMDSYGDEFYVWKAKPIVRSRPAVQYGNRMYTGPVCNNRNCSMCNYIKRMLYQQSITK